MPYDQFGNWVDDFNDYVDKHPTASDEELYKQFPQLGGKPDAIGRALNYGGRKKAGAKQEDLDRDFPEYKPPMIKPGFIPQNKVPDQPVSIKNSPEVHGSVPAQVSESTNHQINIPDNKQTYDQETAYKAKSVKYNAKRTKILSDPKSMLLTFNHIDNKTLEQETHDAQIKLQNGEISKEEYNNLLDKIQSQVFDNSEKRQKALDDLPNNPVLQEHMLAGYGQVHPEEKAETDAARYFTNQQRADQERGIDVPLNAPQRIKNAEDIASGKKIYQNGRIYQPLNTLESIIQTVKQAHEDLNEYDFLKNSTPAARIKKYTDQMNRNQDETIPMPNNIGSLVGGQTPVSAKGALLAFLSSRIPGVGGVASRVIPALGIAGDMAKQSYVNSYKQNFTDQLNKTGDPLQADKEADRLANIQRNIDFVSGAALGAIGGGKTPEFTPGFKTLGMDIIKHLGRVAEGAGPSSIAGAIISGASQAVKNAYSGKPTDEGMNEALLTGGAIPMAMTMLHAGIEVPIKVKNVIAANLAKIPEPQLTDYFNQAKAGGAFTPKDEADVRATIESRGELDKQVDPGVENDEDRVKIANEIKKANDLEEQKKSQYKSAGPSFKEKIDKINEKILQLTADAKKKPAEIKKFADRIVGGEKMESPEDLQFYDNNKSEIEDELRSRQDEVPEEVQPKEVLEATHVRHAESVEDEAKGDEAIVSGRTQTPLGDIGKEQANQLAEDVKGEDIHKVITSDLPRSKETGEIVAKKNNLPIEHDPGLDSWDIGEFSKMKTKEFKKAQKYFVDHPDEKEYEGKKLVESFNEYKDRTMKAQDNLPKDPSVLVVNHSNNMVLADAIKDNGGWNEEAKQQYLKMDTAPPATLPEMKEQEVKGETDEETAAIHEHGQEAAKLAIEEAPKVTPEEVQQVVKKLKIKKSGRKTTTGPSGDGETSPANGELLRPVREGAEAEQGGDKGNGGAEPSAAASSSVGDVGKRSEETRSEPVPSKENTVKFAYAGGKVEGTIVKDNGNTVDIKGKDGLNYPKVEKRHILKEGESIHQHYDTKAKIKGGLQEALPKVGESSAKRTTPKQYADPVKALDAIRAEHPKDKLMNRAADFLQPILEKNPQIRVENADLGGRTLGLSHPDGLVQVDFAAHTTTEEAHRTLLHELIHGATRNEIEKNPAFKEEVRGLLEEIRSKLKLPPGNIGDILIPALVDKGVIPAEKYGGSNEHELLAELFSNQKFHDLVKSLPAPGGDNMLHRIYTKIVQFFNKTYGALSNLKDKINASDMADYLMKLTEGTVKADEKYKTEGPALKKIKDEAEEDDAIRGIIKNVPEDFPRQDLHDAIKEQFPEKTSVSIHRLINEKFAKDHEQALTVPLAKEFYEHDVQPALVKIAGTAKEAIKGIVKMLSPRTLASEKQITTIMRAIGERNEAGAFVDKALSGMERMFDKMTDKDRIAFIDNMKRNNKQPTPELQEIADGIKALDKNLYDAIKQYNPSLAWREDHFRVLWKEIPGAEKSKFWDIRTRRPLEGSKGFMKQATLADMSEGIAKGGVPQTTNPIRMFKLAYADGMKYVTAQKMFWALKDDGMVKFIPRGKDTPDGYIPIDDKIAKKYYPTKTDDGGKIPAGEWVAQEGAGRLLNNHLSKDYIRNNMVGKGLMEMKNLYTAAELSLSGFHAIAESLEATSSQIGLGLRKLVNLKDLSGLKDIVTSPFAAGSTYKTGIKARKFATESDFANSESGKAFLKKVPEAADYIHDFFQGGGLLKQHDDLRAKAFDSFKEHAGKNNYIGAALRVLPAINNTLLDPLFNHYIPALKTGMFFKEFPTLLKENAARLKNGDVTREELARKQVDFIDDRIGEMNFDNLFWSRTFKTAMQFMMRSVTWKLGNIRAMAGAPLEQGMEFINAAKEGRAPNLMPKMAWLMGLTAMQVAISSAIQGIATGKKLESLKDIIAPRIDANDETQRVIPPTYYKDLFHIAHDPAGYVTTSSSGPIGKIIDIWQNKDFYNQEIYDPNDDFITRQKEKLHYFIPKPFSITSAVTQIEQGQGGKAALSFFGLNKSPGYLNHTPIENEIFDLYNIRNTGVKPYKEKEANDEKKLITELYKNGNKDEAQDRADEAVKKGLLKPQQIQRILQRVDNNENPTKYFFQRLPESDKEYLFSKMNEEEKATYDPNGKLATQIEMEKQPQ